jgi:predicted DNA-binding transcriptional regulator AlpA
MPDASKVSNQAATAMPAAPPRLLPLEAVLEQVSLSKTALYDLIRSKHFPAPAKLGRSARWLSSDVDAFVLRVAAAGMLPQAA